MKFTTALAVSASAALVAATGPTLYVLVLASLPHHTSILTTTPSDPSTNTWTCPIADGVYCAGDSLKTNIIIRCTGTVGQPGNCNDNLAGEPPLGVNPTVCYAPALGTAACAKK
jgi:hypothetical protein